MVTNGDDYGKVTCPRTGRRFPRLRALRPSSGGRTSRRLARARSPRPGVARRTTSRPLRHRNDPTPCLRPSYDSSPSVGERRRGFRASRCGKRGGRLAAPALVYRIRLSGRIRWPSPSECGAITFSDRPSGSGLYHGWCSLSSSILRVRCSRALFGHAAFALRATHVCPHDLPFLPFFTPSVSDVSAILHDTALRSARSISC